MTDIVGQVSATRVQAEADQLTAIQLTPIAQSGLVKSRNEVLATGSFTRSGRAQVAQAVRFIATTGNADNAANDKRKWRETA